MKALAVFKKAVLEQARDWLSLSLALSTAPFFVLLYWSFTGGGSTTYTILLMNMDRPVELAGETISAGEGVVEAMESVKYSSGQPMLKLVVITDRDEALRQLENRDANALVILPPELTEGLLSGGVTRPEITLVGDLSNPGYAVAAIFSGASLDAYVQAMTGTPPAYELNEVALGGSADRTEFETYVPGLLIIAVMMLIFSVAMAVARDIETGTLQRLQLTRMTAFDYLVGVSAAQVLVGIGALLFTFFVAWAIGFRSVGPLWAAIAIGVVTAFALVGIGLIIACFSKTVIKAFLVANAPFLLLMFFSGAIYPIPKLGLFSVAGHSIGMWDFLPPTHAVVALNKVLSLGAGFGDVLYELSFLLVLSLVYFATGVVLFRRTQLSAQD
ncbi:MAG: hypothetical protein AUK47_15300 [Deltaproteobacteria bacterium CG2_30_63_29]|nr:MAG: hypothetical protein AUK47_15300 [Deltaproteobacteria bacterium CG2_30_63_29]PJB40822.1 MAG: hypothetical protein CO108_14195 [Deltaproteobacteria bacterium CG_4_9_14_3_um_filter_63_12]